MSRRPAGPDPRGCRHRPSTDSRRCAQRNLVHVRLGKHQRPGLAQTAHHGTVLRWQHRQWRPGASRHGRPLELEQILHADPRPQQRLALHAGRIAPQIFHQLPGLTPGPRPVHPRQRIERCRIGRLLLQHGQLVFQRAAPLHQRPCLRIQRLHHLQRGEPCCHIQTHLRPPLPSGTVHEFVMRAQRKFSLRPGPTMDSGGTTPARGAIMKVSQKEAPPGSPAP